MGQQGINLADSEQKAKTGQHRVGAEVLRRRLDFLLIKGY
jgi:hypothetical protein